MTQGKITASAAMLNVLKTWGVDTIYGIPSGTLSSLMDALAEDKDIRFLQVRHEETGALDVYKRQIHHLGFRWLLHWKYLLKPSGALL